MGIDVKSVCFPASLRVTKKVNREGWRIGAKDTINIGKLTCYVTISETQIQHNITFLFVTEPHLIFLQRIFDVT